MKKSQLITIAIIVIILIAGTCFRLGFAVGKKTLEKELDEARRIINIYAPVPQEVFAINGQIKEIKDSAITLEISSSQLQGPPLPGEESEIEIIKVIVGENTKIITIEKTEITLNKLEIKDWIYVESEENIKNKTEFIAKSIKLIEPPLSETELLEGEIPPPSPEDEPAPAP